MKKFLLFIILPIVVSFGQISISSGGSSVTENFSSMGTSAAATVPANWKVEKITSVRTVGNYSTAVTVTNYAGGVNLSSTAGNGVYNFGLGVSTSATDRALGGISSGTASQSINIYSYFKNTGASTITQVDLSYDVMRFRNGLNAAGFSIQLYYSTNGSTWTSAGPNFLSSFAGPNADNNGAAVVPIETQQILNQTLTGLNLAQNGGLYLAWNYSVTSGTTTTNAQALAIDNFIMNNIGGTSTAPSIVVATTATNIGQTGFRANWNSSTGTTSYLLDISTSASFDSFLSGYENKNVGNVLNFDITGLTLNTPYYYRVRASNSFGTSGNSNTISVSTLAQITSVQFPGISDAVIKSAGTYSLDLSITDPNPTTATTCAVTFISDSSTATASYLNNFTTQTVTFPAGSSANQHVVFTIKDNGVVEPAKKAYLQIQNVTGGSSAHTGTIANFRLSITSGVDNAYYSSIPTGLTGSALKTALYNLIKNCVKFPYTDSSPSKIDVWKMLRAADEDPKNPNNVIGLYSGLSIGKDPQTYWNREHVWSKSHGNFGTDIGAGTDGHHLRPENPTVNTLKSNLDFDNGGSLVPNGGGSKYDLDSWEPRDEVKGDVARMIFYMATRYQGESGEPNLQMVDNIPSSPNNEPFYAKLSTLLVCNQQDPPDAFEMNRNNTIAFYQLNRNPYIDHPEWVSTVFGSITSFIVSTVSNPAIGGTTTGGGIFNSGSSITLTASPNSGYTFKNWTENGIVVSTSLNYNFSISGNRTVDANFSDITPVELTSFSGSAHNKVVKLKWETATEVNNSGFEIEKAIRNYDPPKAEGIRNWTRVGFVKGSGSTTLLHEYSFIDNNSGSGKYLYRLKQIDVDGTFSYSNEIEVDLGTPTAFALEQNYPNPFNPTTSIQYSVVSSLNVMLNVFDVMGKEVAVLVNDKKEPGIYNVEFSTSNLASGTYFYRLQTGEFVQTKKMIILK